MSPNLHFLGYLTSWPQMTFDLDLWPLTTWTYKGSHTISINQVWFQLDFNFLNKAIFTFSAYLTTWPQMTFDLGMWPLISWTYEGSHIISINQVWFQSDLQLFWGHFHIFSLSYNLTSDDLWPWYVTFDLMNIWRFPYYINKPSLVPIGLQLFNWGHFHIFSLSYNLTSDDLWPWYVTFDLINKWGFPCCIYDPTLVEIHQSMKKLEPNVNPSSRQTMTDNNSGQSDPYMSFLLRQAMTS